jgi:hypothetical protein
MTSKIIKEIWVSAKVLTSIAKESRPNADQDSMELMSAIMLLIATIDFINALPKTPESINLIDSLVDELPRSISDRRINLEQAIVEDGVLQRARRVLRGAATTNVLGAFEAIYNTRVTADLKEIDRMKNGPTGIIGAISVVIGLAITRSGETPDMTKIMYVLGQYFKSVKSNVVNNCTSSLTTSVGVSRDRGAGQSACFVATACYGSADNETVIFLRKYRERVLKKNKYGRLFIYWYYKFGPYFAVYIRKHDLLRKFMREVLRYLSRVLFAICKT